MVHFDVLHRWLHRFSSQRRDSVLDARFGTMFALLVAALNNESFPKHFRGYVEGEFERVGIPHRETDSPQEWDKCWEQLQHVVPDLAISLRVRISLIKYPQSA